MADYYEIEGAKQNTYHHSMKVHIISDQNHPSFKSLPADPIRGHSVTMYEM